MDRVWAEWIAWELEEVGFRTVVEAWDFAPGQNFVAEMQRASVDARAVLGVLGESYLGSRYAEDEWTAAFRERKLLLVRVGGGRPGGILGPLIAVDLVEIEEAEGRALLVDAARRFLARLAGGEGRAKPPVAPAFPRPVGERPVSAPVAFPGGGGVRHLPRASNPGFRGREAELAAIEEIFSRGERVALIGLGGVGKSQLAAEYAHAGGFEVVWWLRAETETTLLEDLGSLAVALGLASAEAADLSELAEAARRELEQREGWLLVFDNADSARSLASFLPAGAGRVLISSRDRVWRRVATPVEIGPLALPEAAAFLCERTADRDGEASLALAEELGSLPLALEQAAAYVEAAGTTLAGYLAAFKTQQAALLATEPPVDYPAPVATAWELSFQALEQEAPAAARSLELLAFLAPDEIPIRLLTEHPELLPPELATALGQPLGLDEQVARPLLRYSLVDRDGDHLSLHRLVQAVTRTRIDEQRRQERASQAVSLLLAAFAFEETDTEGWTWAGTLLPHALAAAAQAEALNVAATDVASLLNRAGDYLQTRAQYEEALAAFERALALDERVYGPDHPEVATDLSNLGGLLQQLGQFEEARTALERALAIDERAYGPDYPDVATIVNNLGGLLQDLGQLEEARAAYERALAIDERVYGPDHPKVATGVNNLGSVLQDLGQLEEARIAFERALAIAQTTLGKDHPGTQTIRDKLDATRAT